MTEERNIPGEAIRAAMEARGWTQRDLALILGRPLPAINEVIKGKRAITPEMAIALSDALGIGADHLLRLEASYRLSRIGREDEGVAKRARMFALAPVKDMESRGWIRKTESAEGLEAELTRFFGVTSLDREPEIAAHFRKTAADEDMNIWQRAWCFRARQLAKSIEAAPYSDTRFDAGLKKLHRLVAWPEGARKVPRVLTEMGIRFIIIEPLPKTRVDGVAFWLDPQSPVIALSARFDRMDSFWHTLGHELSHVRHRDEPVVDVDIVGEDRPSSVERSAIERRADDEAAAMWIDPEELKSFILRVGPLYSRDRINQFANRIRVHPGIIVGQLQYRREIGYQALRETLAKVRDSVTSKALVDGWGHVIAH